MTQSMVLSTRSIANGHEFQIFTTTLGVVHILQTLRKSTNSRLGLTHPPTLRKSTILHRVDVIALPLYNKMLKETLNIPFETKFKNT